MIAELKPYPAMKDSRVEWLGEVPEHWEVSPNRALFDEIKDRDCPDEQMLSVTIKKGVIRQASLLEDSSKKDSSNLDRSKYKLVQPADIAYNKMRAWQGAIGVSDYRGIISPAYVVQRHRAGADSRYFHQLLRTPAFAKEAERWSYGITSDMWSLRPEHFKMIYACLPPLPEQAAIVRFLDHVDRRVRRYVRAKQKLIKLLQEQKQAIIHHAVTLGLDPDVPLKPSGVKWLGDVPEHWDIWQIRRITRRHKQGFYTTENYVDLGIRLIRITDIERTRIDWDQMPRVSISPEDEEAFGVLENDFLFARTGGAGLFARAVKPARSVFASYLINFRFDERVAPDYMEYFLQSPAFEEGIQRSIHGGVNRNIHAEDVKNQHIPIPSNAEQKAIVDYLEKATTGIDTAIGLARRQIGLFREYRTRLIADVVTGKVDVRDVVIDEVAEADATEYNGDFEDEEEAFESAEEEAAYDG